jgi:hypothetical protein
LNSPFGGLDHLGVEMRHRMIGGGSMVAIEILVAPTPKRDEELRGGSGINPGRFGLSRRGDPASALLLVMKGHPMASMSVRQKVSEFANHAVQVVRRPVATTITLLASLGLTALVLALSAPAQAHDIVYNMQSYPSQQNNYVITGTLTTDGTIGALLPEDILGYAITISQTGHPTTTINGTSADISLLNLLVATTSEIIVPNPDGVVNTVNSPTFMDAASSAFIDWCIRNMNPIPFDSYFAKDASGNLLWNVEQPNIPLPTPGGDFIIAVAAVPEPSTLAMMLFGIAGLGLVGYYRRQQVSCCDGQTGERTFRPGIPSATQ